MKHEEEKKVSDDLNENPEIEASERRAKRLREVQEEMKNDENSEIAKMLAEIEAKNKKNYE